MKMIQSNARTLRAKASAAALALTASLFSLAAMAQTGPDTSSITTELNTYKVAVVGLVIAFAVVLWAVKGAGLLKPRG